MHSRRLTIGLLAAVVTAGFSVASAAEPLGAVARIQGSALINQGESYIPAREGMAIKEGDRMIATEGSSAIIKFNDGCHFTLQDNQVLTIGAKSACAAADTVASYPVNPQAAAAPAAMGTGALVAAGVAAAAIIGIVIANNNASDDSTTAEELRAISP